jgi:uncharacterized RDD family membrane protein YckC
VSENLPPAPPPPPPPGQPYGAPAAAGNYAGWGARVLAYIVDYIPIILLEIIGFILGKPETKTVTTDGGFEISTTSGFGIWYWVFLLLALVYWFWNRVYRMGSTGQSLGMGVAKTKAVRESDGQVIGVGMNLVRQILLWVDFAICYIGVLWPLWDPKKQCLLSDRVAGAVVHKV